MIGITSRWIHVRVYAHTGMALSDTFGCFNQALDECMCGLGSFWHSELQKCTSAV